MIWKIIKSEFKLLQTLGIILIMLLGFSIVLITAGFYFDIKPSFESQDLWQHEHIIISKKISKSNTISQLFGKGKKAKFSNTEIQEISEQESITDIATFTASTFKSSVHTKGKLLGGFYSEIFFESVPSRYIDLQDATNWGWNMESDFIPIILPKTYLNLYNFGFATSQNLPQINQKAAFALPFIVKLSGNGKHQEFNARIVGFSDRLNTILVPQEFLDFANPKFGTKSSHVSRLILLTPDPSDPALLNFLKSKNYDYNKDQLTNGKARMLLNTISIIVISTGVFISFLALWLFILSSQLLLQRNKNKIVKLKNLGFSIISLVTPFIRLTIISNLVVFILSMPILFIAQKFWRTSLETILVQSNTTNTNLLLYGFIFIAAISIINISLIYTKIKRIKFETL